MVIEALRGRADGPLVRSTGGEMARAMTGEEKRRGDGRGYGLQHRGTDTISRGGQERPVKKRRRTGEKRRGSGTVTWLA